MPEQGKTGEHQARQQYLEFIELIDQLPLYCNRAPVSLFDLTTDETNQFTNQANEAYRRFTSGDLSMRLLDSHLEKLPSNIRYSQLSVYRHEQREDLMLQADRLIGAMKLHVWARRYAGFCMRKDYVNGVIPNDKSRYLTSWLFVGQNQYTCGPFDRMNKVIIETAGQKQIRYHLKQLEKGEEENELISIFSNWPIPSPQF